MPTLLALETSCDESAAAIVRDRTVLASAVASQVEEHARWGGVVPEIASRRHVEALPQLIDQVCRESGVALAELDGIAATAAPGLVGALLVASVTGPHAPALKVGDVVVRIDPRYFRPTEVETLLGDPSKAKQKLGWVPEITLDQMIVEMVASDLVKAKQHALLEKHGYSVVVGKEN